MLRTLVAAHGLWPESAVFTGQARAIPEASTLITGPVIFTYHFFEGAGHRLTAPSEERTRCSRILAQIKAMFCFVSAYHGSNGEGKNVLHGHVELVDGMGDPLAAPLSIAICGAQIVDPYHDGFEWACE
jgi:hypothetical protein